MIRRKWRDSTPQAYKELLSHQKTSPEVYLQFREQVGPLTVSFCGSAQESGEGRILGGFLKNPSEDVRDWKPRSWSGAPMGELIRNLLKQLGSGRTQPGSIDR